MLLARHSRYSLVKHTLHSRVTRGNSNSRITYVTYLCDRLIATRFDKSYDEREHSLTGLILALPRLLDDRNTRVQFDINAYFRTPFHSSTDTRAINTCSRALEIPLSLTRRTREKEICNQHRRKLVPTRLFFFFFFFLFKLCSSNRVNDRIKTLIIQCRGISGPLLDRFIESVEYRIGSIRSD